MFKGSFHGPKEKKKKEKWMKEEKSDKKGRKAT